MLPIKKIRVLKLTFFVSMIGIIISLLSIVRANFDEAFVFIGILALLTLIYIWGTYKYLIDSHNEKFYDKKILTIFRKICFGCSILFGSVIIVFSIYTIGMLFSSPTREIGFNRILALTSFTGLLAGYSVIYYSIRSFRILNYVDNLEVEYVEEDEVGER